MAGGEDYLDVEQIQELLHVSRATVWNILNRYDLERYQIPTRGKRTLVKKSDLLAALERPIPVRKKRAPGAGKARAAA